MNGNELYYVAEAVKSRNDFLDFLDELKENYSSHRDEWDNDNLEAFLEGYSAFADSIGGYYKNMHEEVDIETITWRMAAQMLLAAKVHS